MQELKLSDLKGKLYIPPPESHKGQNGKLLIIGGSHLFHAASLWALKIASKIVDMVFYHSVPENLEMVKEIKKEFYDGIVVTSERIGEYISEADCILCGPGLPRGNDPKDYKQSTKELVYQLLTEYPEKRFVFDASALQEMNPKWLKIPKQRVIVTPHEKEFERLFKFQIASIKSQINFNSQNLKIQTAQKMAKKYNCVILLKGPTDIICCPSECKTVTGGNAGMTKGGTGDVLAGLTAALYCKNDAFLSAYVASYVNKKAGESLFKKVGYFFNASDLVEEIPRVLKEIL